MFRPELDCSYDRNQFKCDAAKKIVHINTTTTRENSPFFWTHPTMMCVRALADANIARKNNAV